jgi:fatty-acid desaturase
MSPIILPSQEELKKSNRWFKSATPKYTPDWYIKWVASVFILAAMSMRGVEGLQFYDLVLSIIGLMGWLVVAAIWEDRALIIVNSFGLLFMLKNLVTLLVN